MVAVVSVIVMVMIVVMMVAFVMAVVMVRRSVVVVPVALAVTSVFVVPSELRFEVVMRTSLFVSLYHVFVVTSFEAELVVFVLRLVSIHEELAVSMMAMSEMLSSVVMKVPLVVEVCTQSSIVSFELDCS